MLPGPPRPGAPLVSCQVRGQCQLFRAQGQRGAREGSCAEHQLGVAVEEQLVLPLPPAESPLQMPLGAASPISTVRVGVGEVASGLLRRGWAEAMQQAFGEVRLCSLTPVGGGEEGSADGGGGFCWPALRERRPEKRPL